MEKMHDGKPALDPEYHGEILSFNLSHAQEPALYAIAQKRQLGIDLEYVRTDFGWEEDILPSFFVS